MGCDVHIFVEGRLGRDYKEALVDGEFNIGRDYRLFAAIAGVRRLDDFVPHIAPRGLPRDVSSAVADRYYLPVMSREQAAAWCIGEHATPSQAVQHVDSGRSHWREPGTSAPSFPSTHDYVSNPDWHHPSWLSPSEFVSALNHAGYDLARSSPEVRLLARYLECAEEQGLEPRMVFWFDN